MTDHQREKLYRAESAIARKMPALSEPISEAEAWNLIVRLSRTFETTTPRLKVSNRMKNAGKYRMGEITVNGRYGLTLLTVIHEFAHHLATKEGQYGHRWGFANALIRCYSEVFTEEVGKTLRREFGDRGITYTKAQDKKRIAKLDRAYARRKSRDGQEGRGWIVARKGLYGIRFLKPGKLVGTAWAENVGVWRRYSSVADWDDRVDWAVVEVDVIYSADEGRWVVDRDSYGAAYRALKQKWNIP